MVTTTAPSVVIDTIVLAFSRSRLKDVVGTDALRAVLSGTKGLVPDKHTLSLAPVWELLEGQPGFVAEDALAPMCRIKAWEPYLNMTVELPVPAAELDSGARARHAADCYIDERDLMRVLHPVVVRSTPTAGIAVQSTPVVERVQPASDVTERVRAAVSDNRRTIIAGAALVASIIAVIVSAYLTFGGSAGSTQHLSAADVSKEIPLTRVRQSGSVVGATLADPAWLNTPVEERRIQIERAYAQAAARGARDLMVYDKRGTLIATAASQRGRVVVTFMR